MPRFQNFRNYIVPIILTALFSINAVARSREHVIYAFRGSPDCGNLPTAQLIADANGNLYGTTFDGGANKMGCVFELSRDTNGKWSESVLHSFSGSDGGYPAAALVFDQSGNLYGTAAGGGVYGGGVAFELSPSSNGEWTETVLYNFGGPDDGFTPECQLVFDSAGNLYGTTGYGGPHRSGTVFELSPGPSGWTETILHAFSAQIYGPGAAFPSSGVVMDSDGNLYGVTGFGGAYGAGAAYELKLKDGVYRLRLIHNFDQSDGGEPNSVTFGPDGNLYGTASFGGVSLACDCGVVFELAKAARGQWIEHTLLSLDGSFGFRPVGPPAFDDEGNLYAAAMSGGPIGKAGNGIGSVYELTPRANGTWAESTLHIFFFNFSNKIDRDGTSPYAGVTIVGNKLFGTTSSGGIHNEGTVFVIRLRPDVGGDEDSETPGELD